MSDEPDRRTYGDRRNHDDERLRRLEISVAVLEVSVKEIKDGVNSARNYSLTTLIGVAGFLVWQVVTHGLGVGK